MGNTDGVQCPSCGGPATDLPADPKATITCTWCGVAYERTTAEQALGALQEEIKTWLQKTTGVAAAEGAEAVDTATRSFLFNDRILPGLRRDVRRAIDEGVGDVQGSPVFVPPVLRQLSGFRDGEATLVSRREAVCDLRRLRARLEAADVTAFATSAADEMALAALRLEIDRTLLASNAACAFAGGVAAGASRARTNLEKLTEEARTTTIEQTVDPGGALLAQALVARCEALAAALSAAQAQPPELPALRAAADKLEETASWLLTADSRSLRAALASTGVHRDATAVRALTATAESIGNADLSAVDLLDGLAPLAPLLAGVGRSKDATFLISAWASAAGALRGGTPLPHAADTSWIDGAVAQACGAGERRGHLELALVPFLLFQVRHAKSEGLFLVSGRQYEGLGLVPLSGHESGTMILDSQDPAAATLTAACQHPVPTQLAVEPPCIGPEAARRAARAALRQRDIKNVSIGSEALVYMPVAMVRFDGHSGQRLVALSPRGQLPHDPRQVSSRCGLLRNLATQLSPGSSGA